MDSNDAGFQPPLPSDDPSPPPTTDPAVLRTDLRLPGKRSGKVRDTYHLPNAAAGVDAIAMIATDRISAFDVVLPTPIPGKGKMLTQMAAFWLDLIDANGLGPTHLISTEHTLVPDTALTDTTRRVDLIGRTTIGQRCAVIPVECVVRGYLEGTGWNDYTRTGSVCGVGLPEGLKRCAKLPEPIFTPATKAESGHDENIGFEAAAAHIRDLGGDTLLKDLRDRSLAIYTLAAEHAIERGIILADTKFEFGLPLRPDGSPDLDADPVLIDEALTPDSSRFWPAASYAAGRTQPSYDKQFVREYLQSRIDAGQWDKRDPGPALPSEVVEGTIARYREALKRLTAS